MTTATEQFQLTLPGTNEILERDGSQLVSDQQVVATRVDGIWDLVRAERRTDLERFAHDYAAVRAAEDRALSPQQIQRLPYVSADHPLHDMWQQRAASYERCMAATSLLPRGSAVDIGAGCGWLAAHLSRAGWTSAAIDITVEGPDGLSAARHHDEDMLLIRAEMQALPLADHSVDLAVFNASLHYAANPQHALREARRVLRPTGTLVVLDSPVFTDPAAGRAMVQEFDSYVLQQFGLSAATHQGPGFLSLADVQGFVTEPTTPTDRLRSRLHQWRSKRQLGREAATRPLLIDANGGTS